MRKFFAFAAGGVVLAEATAKPNPIRRIVTLLQEMAEEIETEVEKEKKQYEKFQCYCKKNDGALDAKAKEAAALIKKTKAEVESLTGQKKALAEDLKKHKKDREEAKKNLDLATKKRTEEKSKYDEATKEQKKTLEDIDKAISALEKGMGKSFLQTSAADYLKTVIDQNQAALSNLDVDDQEAVVSFLQNKKDYAPAGGEIVGILKTMKDNFDESLGGIIKEEEEAVAGYKKLKASLVELIQASGAAIEKKTELKGQVAVKIVEGKNVISTTEKQMGDDMATLAELKEACSGKGNEFATRQKDAAAEVDAINMAIGVLNNDDALQLFNKTDTKDLMQTSLLQLRAKKNDPRALVLEQLNQLSTSNKSLAMLAFSAKQALKSRTGVDFSKILTMIDEMVTLLKKEADDDLASRDQCNEDFNSSAAEKKETEHAIKGLTAVIEELTEVIAAQAAIVEKSAADVVTAKESMAEATKQREGDNAAFVEAVDLNKQAVELIQKAKNKLNVYYNPQLVPKEKAPELSAEEELEAGARSVLIQKHSFAQEEKLPEGQPEIFAGERKNKGQKGSSVLALMDMLAGDVNKDTTALEKDEAVAQSEYEKLSQDLANQVAESTKAGNDAAATKAKAEEDKQTAESTLSMKEEELADVKQTIADLHAQCDFILGAFEERKAARENEISGLGKAKAILSGAKFD
jgi:chromosome segregation ATPase